MTDEEIRDLCLELRDEPVPADSLARVRFGLEERLRRRSRWNIRIWAMAGAAALLAVGLLESWPLIRRPAAIPIVSHVPAPPPVYLPPEVPLPVVRPAIRKTPRRQQEAPSQAISIRIETADPNVVILLIGD